MAKKDTTAVARAPKGDKTISQFEATRNEIWKKMTPDTQRVAEELQEKLVKAAEGFVLVRYDMGKQLVEVIDQEATYGSNAVDQLSEWLNFPGGTTSLYALCNFARAFDRDWLRNELGKFMTNGRSLELGHFIVFSKLKTKGDRATLLKKCRTECMTVNQLEEEYRAAYEPKNVRSGGRKPQIPSSPIATLLKVFTLGQKFDNFLEAFEGDPLHDLGEIAPDQINEKLLERFNGAKQMLTEARVQIDTTLEAMGPVGERLKKVIDEAQPEPAEEDDDNAEDGAEGGAAAKPPESSKKTGGKKPAKKNSVKGGKATNSKAAKGAKTAKRTRPAAA